MRRAVIAVDVQMDFLPGGPLGVPDGDKIIKPLTEIMNQTLTDVIVFTQDWHPPNHFSFSEEPKFKDGSWPEHCVQGTRGADIADGLELFAKKLNKPIIYVQKGVVPAMEAYSGFEGRVVETENVDQDLKGMNLFQALKGLGVTEVVIGGLALDYCVRATANDAAHDFETYVDLESTRPVDTMGGLYAVADFAAYGVNIW